MSGAGGRCAGLRGRQHFCRGHALTTGAAQQCRLRTTGEAPGRQAHSRCCSLLRRCMAHWQEGRCRRWPAPAGCVRAPRSQPPAGRQPAAVGRPGPSKLAGDACLRSAERRSGAGVRPGDCCRPAGHRWLACSGAGFSMCMQHGCTGYLLRCAGEAGGRLGEEAEMHRSLAAAGTLIARGGHPEHMLRHHMVPWKACCQLALPAA